MTEKADLLKKQKAGKATPVELTRLKVLIDGEPLTKADLETAKKREADQHAADIKAYDEKHKKPTGEQEAGSTDLDAPAEHPRIAALKLALNPFTQLEVHDSRPNEFVLIVRGISITAGDVRKARKAIKL